MHGTTRFLTPQAPLPRARPSAVSGPPLLPCRQTFFFFLSLLTGPKGLWHNAESRDLQNLLSRSLPPAGICLAPDQLLFCLLRSRGILYYTSTCATRFSSRGQAKHESRSEPLPNVIPICPLLDTVTTLVTKSTKVHTRAGHWVQRPQRTTTVRCQVRSAQSSRDHLRDRLEHDPGGVLSSLLQELRAAHETAQVGTGPLSRDAQAESDSHL